MSGILVGTTDGLRRVGAGGEEVELAGREVVALARDGSAWWALAGGDALVRLGGALEEVARVAPWPGTCLLAGPAGLLVGTAEAHLLRLDGRALSPVDSFDRAEGREGWYTPWGGPPDTRSLAAGPDGVLWANVHVGGILRSADGGATWQPTIDVHADVHQVLAHPSLPGVALAAAARGLAVTRDGGATWTVHREGLHAAYCRAVALAGDTVLVSASEGPSGRRAAVYRTKLDAPAMERATQGLPEWFDGNVDTACLDARGSIAGLAAPDGSVFVSDDAGQTWTEAARGLPPVRCLALI